MPPQPSPAAGDPAMRRKSSPGPFTNIGSTPSRLPPLTEGPEKPPLTPVAGSATEPLKVRLFSQVTFSLTYDS